MSLPDFKLSCALIIVLAINFCPAKSVRFNAGGLRFAGLFAQVNETSDCYICNTLVTLFDYEQITKIVTTPEQLANVIKHVCAQPRQPEACKAFAGKELPFAQAYFKHVKDKEVNPCKEVKIC